MFFFTASADCGCGPSGIQYGGAQNGCAPSFFPPNGAIIADNRYFSLLTAPQGQLLLVPKGSNTQAFLKGAAGFRGFVFYAGEEVALVNAPMLTLPLVNPAVSGAFPATGATFPYIMVGTGDPAAWQMVHAPTAGSWMIQANGGVFSLVDAGTIPGMDTIGGSPSTVLKGGLTMIVENPAGSGHYTLKRMAVVAGHTIVGDVDEFGVQGFKVLGDTQPLKHPISEFQELRFNHLVALDDTGTVLSELPLASMFGVGSIADPTRLVYSPANKKIYKAPATTVVVTNVPTNLAAAGGNITASYANIPGGHGAGISGVFNFRTVRVDFNAAMTSGAASNTQSFGVFRDGILLQEFDNDIATQVSLVYIDQACPFGSHTYDVRWKRVTGTANVGMRYSYLTVATVP